MSSFFDPNNKNGENQLRRMAESLPSMVKEQARGRSHRNGHEKPFTRFCPICSLAYARSKVFSTAEAKAGVCEGCRKRLLDGETALVTISKRYAFVKGGGAPAGKIINITEEEMDAVKKRFEGEA
jgi:hypothetical protein